MGSSAVPWHPWVPTPGPLGTQPHRLGGPFCHPLAPRHLLEASAFPRDRLPALVFAARLHLPDVHPAVLAEGLPAVRQLGERGGWGETGRLEVGQRGSAAGRAPTGRREDVLPAPRAGQHPWDLDLDFRAGSSSGSLLKSKGEHREHQGTSGFTPRSRIQPRS